VTGIDGLVLQTAGVEDVDLAVEWAAREGWNPGWSDAGCFRAADPEGFLVGRIDGEPVSVISAVRYPDDFAFLGLYIVAPHWRGRGAGWATWSAAMASVEEYVVGLDGVVEQQANYARSGFVLAHRNVRYGGLPRSIPTRAAEPMTRADHPGVATLDRACFGVARPAFLGPWLNQPGAHGAVVRSSEGIAAYGVIRPCRVGWKIGPLFAADADKAADVLGALLSRVDEGEPVFLDVPEPNHAAVDLALRVGLEPVFETARMYRGGDPGLPVQRIFGITTFELG
jgi:hypothetical protein